VPSILVICTGNINRSPFAAALLRRELSDNWEVSSAGLTADGLEPPDRMVEAALAHDVDLRDHRSRLLSSADIDTADLVLCMDRTHPVPIASLNDAAVAKTFTMQEALARMAEASGASIPERVASATSDRPIAAFLAPRYPDVADPMGRRKRAYRAATAELASLVDRLVAVLEPTG
jgi:protein-tyrosine phosphatase